MNIFIAGGAWFVWKRLVEKLLELWHTIIVLDKSPLSISHTNLKVYVKDLSVESSLWDIQESIDVVVDCIGRQYVDTKVPRFWKEKFFDEVNVWVTKKLVTFSAEKKVKHFIYLSSDMVYGVPKNFPLTESHPCSPIGEYGASKLKAEALVESFSETLWSTLILRPRFIIWPWRGGVFAHLLSLFKHHLPVPLLGSGNNIYQMIHRDDLVDFIILSIEKNITGTIHLGSKSPIPFLEIYDTIKKTTWSHSIVFPTSHTLNTYVFRFFAFLGFPLLHKEQYLIADKDYVLDTTKAESYGWNPKVSDKQAIIEAIQKNIW